MTTSKIIPSLPTGLTLTEYLETRVDSGEPFVYHSPFGGIPTRRHYQTDIPPHHLVKAYFWSYKTCKRCGFKTQNVSDLRKNKGCNMFSNADTDKKDWRLKFEDIKRNPRTVGVRSEPWFGCNTESRQEWVYYPEVGEAIQNDKFIKEQVILKR